MDCHHQFCTNPLLESILNYYFLDPETHISKKFYLKFKHCHLRKSFLKSQIGVKRYTTYHDISPYSHQDTYCDTEKLMKIYSVSPIYRGRVYCGIGYIAVACWTPFFGAQERDIFREIAVTPWTQFAGDNFSRNLLTAIAFVPGSQETIFREINSSLPVNAGWNTCCATVSHVRRSIDTSIVSQSGAQLIYCQCKSRLQIANLGINKAF